MAYSADTFVADEQPTTAKWNKLWSNDASFNDGTGIGDDTIDSRHYVAGSIDPEHLASTVWGWEELSRSTLGSAADTISPASFTAKKYLQIIYSCQPTGGAITAKVRFNGDTGNNYANRQSDSGAADGTQVSQGSLFGDATTLNAPFFGVINVVNISAQEKICLGMVVGQSTAGAGTAPTKRELVGKWANTSAQITSVSFENDAAGTYNTGSEVIVLGHN